MDPVNPFAAEPNSSHTSTPTLSRATSQDSSHARGSVAASASPPPTQRASFPDPAKEPRRGSSRLAGPQPKTDFCCDRDRQITRGDEISIIDAVKTSEGGKSSYITYVIQIGTVIIRRRYSSFLSLHQALSGLYPVLIIPPIPSKQSITDYAVKGQSKTKEDATIIAKRKRLLEDFLRRLIRHPILGGEHVLHRFLEDGVSWSEVLHSPPVSLLPKNPLHAPSHNPTFQDQTDEGDTSPTPNSYIAHHLVPNPSASHPLHHPDQRFQESEAFTDKFHQHFQSQMEKVNRRAVKRWNERATDMSELGGQWNGFSLTEQGTLGTAIEKVGQAVDADYVATTGLLNDWEVTATEPLHVYTQFAALIRSRLSFRHQKHVQYELVQEALDTQRDKLELLEAAERESRRLEDALESGGVTAPTTPAKTAAAAAAEPTPEASPSRSTLRRPQSSFGLLSAVKHSLSGMMDVDPEATRRANIGKTKDNISQLEDSLQASAQDLKYASTTLQADLDRFQRQKVADLRTLAIELSTMHREWCRKNLEAWKEAQEAIRDIPAHPNKPPPGVVITETPSVPYTETERDLPPVPSTSSSPAKTFSSMSPTRTSSMFSSSSPKNTSGFSASGFSGSPTKLTSGFSNLTMGSSDPLGAPAPSASKKSEGKKEEPKEAAKKEEAKREEPKKDDTDRPKLVTPQATGVNTADTTPSDTPLSETAPSPAAKTPTAPESPSVVSRSSNHIEDPFKKDDDDKDAADSNPLGPL